MSSREFDVRVAGERSLHVFDSAAGDAADGLPLIWHHGTPQTGAPLPPVVEPAARRGLRVVTYARPAYGGSTSLPGRNVASAAQDVQAIADALGIERFVTMGASGGGPHALACAALLGERVLASVTLAGVAPWTDEFDWYAGMASPEALRAAAQGRDARARFAETEEFNPEVFVELDWAALQGEWSSLGADSQRAGTEWPDGAIDDDVAFASPWGFDVETIASPVLLVQGGLDRMIPASHAEWLMRHIPTAELWRRPRDGHVSVLNAVPVAMDWILAQVGPPR